MKLPTTIACLWDIMNEYYNSVHNYRRLELLETASTVECQLNKVKISLNLPYFTILNDCVDKRSYHELIQKYHYENKIDITIAQTP